MMIMRVDCLSLYLWQLYDWVLKRNKVLPGQSVLLKCLAEGSFELELSKSLSQVWKCKILKNAFGKTQWCVCGGSFDLNFVFEGRGTTHFLIFPSEWWENLILLCYWETCVISTEVMSEWDCTPLARELYASILTCKANAHPLKQGLNWATAQHIWGGLPSKCGKSKLVPEISFQFVYM